MFTVYILYSETLQKYYTGQTHDLEKRLVEHNSGETKSTKRGIPWTIVWQTIVSSRHESLILERKIFEQNAFFNKVLSSFQF